MVIPLVLGLHGGSTTQSAGNIFTESKVIFQLEFCLGDISGTRTDIIGLLKYSHLGAQRVQ
jgi:hypothetical protein